VTVSNFSGEDVVLRTSAANVGLAAPLCATVASGATASFAAPLHLLWDVAGAASGKALRTSTLINLPYTFYLSPSASDPEGVVDYECTKNWLLPAAAWGGCFAAAAWLRHGTPEFVADPALCARTFGGDPSFCARLEATTPVTSFMRTPLFYVGVVGAAVLAVPLARRGFLTAAVLGFAHTVGEFGVVLMIGGNIPGQTQVLSIAIYDRVESLHYREAHLLSAGLLIFSFAALLAIYTLTRQPDAKPAR